MNSAARVCVVVMQDTNNRISLHQLVGKMKLLNGVKERQIHLAMAQKRSSDYWREKEIRCELNISYIFGGLSMYMNVCTYVHSMYITLHKYTSIYAFEFEFWGAIVNTMLKDPDDVDYVDDGDGAWLVYYFMVCNVCLILYETAWLYKYDRHWHDGNKSMGCRCKGIRKGKPIRFAWNEIEKWKKWQQKRKRQCTMNIVACIVGCFFFYFYFIVAFWKVDIASQICYAFSFYFLNYRG